MSQTSRTTVVPSPRKTPAPDQGERTSRLAAAWARALGAGDVAQLTLLYADDATLSQPSRPDAMGREQSRAAFSTQMRVYADAGCDSLCTIVDIVQQGPLAVVAWQDPLGLQGCSLLRFDNGLIVDERDYWDSASWRMLYAD